MSAADCFIVLTESLTKKAVVPSNRQKSSDSTAPIRWNAILPNSGSDKKNKPLEVTNSEMENIVWDHLEELIHLMQKLLAVSFFFGF